MFPSTKVTLEEGSNSKYCCWNKFNLHLSRFAGKITSQVLKNLSNASGGSLWFASIWTTDGKSIPKPHTLENQRGICKYIGKGENMYNKPRIFGSTMSFGGYMHHFAWLQPKNKRDTVPKINSLAEISVIKSHGLQVIKAAYQLQRRIAFYRQTSQPQECDGRRKGEGVEELSRI